MRDYKWGKSIVFIIICAFIGYIVGGVSKAVITRMDIEVVRSSVIAMAPNLYIVALVCGVLGLIGYIVMNSFLKKDGYSNEEGSFFDRHENKISVVMTCSTLCAIINFTAIGVNLNEKLSRFYITILIVNVVLAFIGEVANVSLVKRVRPELNADPTEAKFKKHIFDQMDEYEKIQVGRASVKTLNAMMIAYLTVFVCCWALIAAFEVSPIICLPVGILWFVQTIIYVVYSSKKDKAKQ